MGLWEDSGRTAFADGGWGDPEKLVPLGLKDGEGGRGLPCVKALVCQSEEHQEGRGQEQSRDINIYVKCLVLTLKTF